jgi:disulfide bond formation protein DsbB
MTPAEVADVEGIVVTAGLLAALALAIASSNTRVRAQVAAALGGTATWLATGIALLAMAGSLWFSESAGFPPCQLCWYQRIAMYPLVVVLGIAAARRSATGRITGITLAAIGLSVSVWHILVENYPSLDSGGCDPDNPCTIRWVEGLGFWTIPRMAAACFALILVLTTIDHLTQRTPKD